MTEFIGYKALLPVEYILAPHDGYPIVLFNKWTDEYTFTGRIKYIGNGVYFEVSYYTWEIAKRGIFKTTVRKTLRSLAWLPAEDFTPIYKEVIVRCNNQE
jgi:hypothetical protein